MTVTNVLLAGLTLACAYIAVTQASYYAQAPPPGSKFFKLLICTRNYLAI